MPTLGKQLPSLIAADLDPEAEIWSLARIFHENAPITNRPYGGTLIFFALAVLRSVPQAGSQFLRAHDSNSQNIRASYLPPGDFHQVHRNIQRWDMLCRITNSGHFLRWRPKRSAGGLLGTAWDDQIGKWMTCFQIAFPASAKPYFPLFFRIRRSSDAT